MTRQRRASVRALTALGLVLLPAWYSGCQVVETPQAHEAYYEHDYMWCGNYALDFAGARVAALVALTELKMPVYREGPLRNGIFIDTRTPDNFEARVTIIPLGRPGQGTRIGVRVGGFGTHRQVCERLLDEITRHQDAVRSSAAVPTVPGPPPAVALPASSASTTALGPPSQVSEAALPPQPVPVQ